jgi:hypothetical protein
MKSMLALAATALIGLSVPALAQEAGAPGAGGASGPLTGHNTPGSSVDPQWTYNDNSWDNDNRGEYYGPRHRFGPPADFDEDNREGPVYYQGQGYGSYGPGYNNGRAAGLDNADHTPGTVRGDQNGQDDAD